MLLEVTIKFKHRVNEMNKMKNKNLLSIIVSIVSLFGALNIYAGEKDSYISTEKSEGYFTLAEYGMAAPIYVSSEDHAGVLLVLDHFKNDIKMVTGIEPLISKDTVPSAKEIVIIGSIDKSPIINKLIEDGKLNVNNIKGKWEASLIHTIENPYPGVEKALVIIGSDKRGTIYGMFDVSKKIGVSPWYWWADVPPKRKDEIYVKPGYYSFGEPKVKYRGIFINDEAPALTGWAEAKFGTQLFNHEFYQHVFELILRMRGNFLWPGMWGKSFFDDDPENPILANEYGIVISTSHHEPLMRAHVEWERYGSGPWNYETNAENLLEFWREGIERMGDKESIVTLAMRGDGDEAMSPDANVSLLEKIVKDQREIIADVTDKPISETPQVWALYKEVQEYYDKGMRVPDDVTLLLCDDNWGNIRILPNLEAPKREGGYGIYYHYDFVGGPRNYKWLNVTQIERVWEQMHLAYEYGAQEIWIVNVGDIKPMEFPISFWFDYAWNPNAISAEDLPNYYRKWAEDQFGSKYADLTAKLIQEYTRFNSRRTPELLSPETYSLTNYREAERIVEDYSNLEKQASEIYKSLSEEYKASFYQLVLHPIEACANLNELYVSAGKNKFYAEQGRASTNFYAEKTKELFTRDERITEFYNDTLSNGKWKHMMDQTHIGYTYWQQPEKNTMPEVKKIELPKKSEMGVAIEGSDKWWQSGEADVSLPMMDNYNQQERYIEIFNHGSVPFNFTVDTKTVWLHTSLSSGTIQQQQRIWLSADWEDVPEGEQSIPIKITGPDNSVVTVNAVVNKSSTEQYVMKGFIESNGYISIEASHYNQAIENDSTYWQLIPCLGRTLSAMSGYPVTSKPIKIGKDSPHLEYNINFASTGEMKLNFYLSPTLNFQKDEGLLFAVSFDDEEPQILNMHADATRPDWTYPQWWNTAVSNNVMIKSSTQKIDNAGEHTLKFWMIDPGVVLQKIVIDTGGLKPSYLGPLESFKQSIKNDSGKLE